MLLSKAYKNVSVGEMRINGLEYAKTYGISGLYQFDILETPFTDHFDIVCMFDVIEHIERDDQALKNAAAMLRKGGRIIITVPSYQWLWSNIDYNSGHKRRYAVKMMKNLLDKADLKLIFISHFFFFIMPMLFVSVLTNKKKYNIADNVLLARKAGLTIDPFLNGILNFVCKIECGFLKLFRFKTGGIMIAVCKNIIKYGC